MQVLQFIFSSFWVFIGVVILIALVGTIISETLTHIFSKD